MTYRRGFLVLVLLAAAAVAACWAFWPGAAVPPQARRVGRPPRIDPDYSDCTIPPNIAPLNFLVREPGTEYRVRVRSPRDPGFVVSSRTPKIVFPPEKWKSLLEAGRGDPLRWDVYVRAESGAWRQFDTLSNTIARDPIDPYLVYRRLKPVHNFFANMGTYQRDVTTCRETPVLRSNPDSRRCVNCHTFTNRDPATMCLHVRAGKDGAAMLLGRGATASKIDTRTDFNHAPAAYSAWHPDGRVAAFASIEVVQFHHAAGNSRDVFVHNSDLGLYFVDSNTVRSTPQIADPERLETFPAWSPDGKYLYFCSGPRLWEEGLKNKGILPLNYREARYDLMRIGYDPATRAFGKLEPVLAAGDTGLSINEPRISPDGRFLLFCMADYGCFPVYCRSSDLYMMDLETRRYWPLESNSDRSDSWHCWSANGRWIAYASKRRDGLFGRVYFSYIDPDGRARKPLLLPQADPAFYHAFLDNFNAPELIVRPIEVKERELVGALDDSELQKAPFAGMLPDRGAVARREEAAEPTADGPPASGKIDAAAAQRLYQRGLASETDGRIAEAVRSYRDCIERLPAVHPAQIPASNRLAWLYATHPSAQVRNGEEAVLMAVNAYKNATLLAEHGRDKRMRRIARGLLPSVLDTLAAAYAECGGFSRAAETALEAETLALRRGDVELAVRIRGRIDSYLADKPYRAVDTP